MTAETSLYSSGRTLRGVALMMAAVFCFTGIDSCAKELVKTLPTHQVVFVRFAGHLAIMVAIFLPLYGGALGRSRALKFQALRGLLLLGGTLFNFLAVRHLPLAVTSSIFFTIPLMVCALSVPILGERVGPRRWAAIVIGFVGVLIVVRPGLGALHWAWGYALIAALCLAGYALTTRRVAGSDPVDVSQLYLALVPSVVMAAPSLATWVWPQTGLEWALFLMIGCWGWLGHQCMTLAYRDAPASTLAPFGYTQIVWMTGSGYLFFGDSPDLWVFVGAGVVIGCGVYLWMRERQASVRG